MYIVILFCIVYERVDNVVFLYMIILFEVEGSKLIVVKCDCDVMCGRVARKWLRVLILGLRFRFKELGLGGKGERGVSRFDFWKGKGR